MIRACILLLVLFSLSSTTQALSAELPRRIGSANSPASGPSLAILSIIPAQAEPGGRVLMSGSGFGGDITAILGGEEIPARVSDGSLVEFIVPSRLQPGLYVLYLKRPDGVISRLYNFTILPLRPVLSSLSPDQIGSCARGRDREVLAQGRNFTENSLLLFDGAGIRSHFVSQEVIAFTVPQSSGGLHQIMVKNPPDTASQALALVIETRPEISQITRGNEQVSEYELIISGKNFQQGATLYVDGQRVGGRGGEREKLIYQDCTRLIYQRHPYSQVNKDLQILVVNPDGESSQVVNVTAP
jgi:hypothetical protein